MSFTKKEAIDAIERVPALEKEFKELIYKIENEDKSFISRRILEYVSHTKTLSEDMISSINTAADYLKFSEEVEDQDIFQLICESTADFMMVNSMLNHLYMSANVNAGAESLIS